MFFWFIGLAVAGVWLAFRSPAIDYRLVAVGSILPLVDGVAGGARFLHSLSAAVGAMAVVMVATRGRRLRRRALLGVPIGMLAHLVLDGAWLDAETFWWPFLGGPLDAALPELERGLLLAPMELAGLVALWWFQRRFDLQRPQHRQRFWRTGQLPRDTA